MKNLLGESAEHRLLGDKDNEKRKAKNNFFAQC